MSSESEDVEYDSELDEEEAVLANATAPGQAAEDREPINNVEALEEALEDIAWPVTTSWLEAQAINSAEATAIDDVEDDLSRELAFYNQALAAANRGVAKLEAAGVPWRRPTDYYAEMVKSDDHMLKVKEQLMFQQRQIKETEQRRKQREMKKFGKQVSAEVRKDRAANKKAAVDSISRLRKARAKGGYEGDLDMDAELQRLDRRQNAAMAVRGDRMGPGGKKPAAKREARNSRYGFGGRKRLAKQNDAASAADMEGFRISRADRAGGGRGRGRGRGRGGFGSDGGFSGSGGAGRGASPGGDRGKGKKGKANRPGKERRAAMRR